MNSHGALAEEEHGDSSGYGRHPSLAPGVAGVVGRSLISAGAPAEQSTRRGTLGCVVFKRFLFKLPAMMNAPGTQNFSPLPFGAAYAKAAPRYLFIVLFAARALRNGPPYALTAPRRTVNLVSTRAIRARPRPRR